MSLAKRHLIDLNEEEIANLLFEINNYTLPKIKEWKKFTVFLDKLPPTNLPHFLKLKSTDLSVFNFDPQNWKVNPDFFKNVHCYESHLVVVPKVNVSDLQKDE